MVSAAIIDSINDPRAALSRLFLETGKSDEEFSSKVAKHFSTLFKEEALFSEIPNLSVGQPPECHNKGSLVRFRGMVQDTLAQEVYIGTILNNDAIENPGGWGMADTAEFNEDQAQFDYARLKERTPLWVVSVPGESDWVDEALSGDQSDISDATSPTATSVIRPHKFPTNEPHIGAQVKIYDASAPSFKPTDIVTSVGVLTLDVPSSDAFDAPESSERIPTIHVLFSRTHDVTIAPFQYPMVTDGDRPENDARSTQIRAVRDELIDWIANQGLCGDRDAAEWVLAIAVSRVHSRNALILPPSLTISSFPTPIVNPDASAPEPALRKLLALVVPLTAHVNLPLNLTSWAKLSTQPSGPQTSSETSPDKSLQPLLHFSPRSESEDLHSGVLQLPKGTILTVSETGIEEGRLSVSATENLDALRNVVRSQKLRYKFPFSSYEFPTDIPTIVLTEGGKDSKSVFVPDTDIVVLLQPASNHSDPYKSKIEVPSADKLEAFRQLVCGGRMGSVKVSEAVSKHIQSDFVQERKEFGAGPSGVTPEELAVRMNVARLMALTYHESEVTPEIWNKVKSLDRRRKALLQK